MFDELYERKKLEGLDLTDDVIEIIIRKKKANYEQKMESLRTAETAKIIEVIVDEIPEVEEPTFYPPEPEPEPEPKPSMVTVVEAVMAPIITKRRLPWQRK